MLVLTADGVQGSLLTTVSTTTPGVAFTGPFALQVDTTGPADVVRLNGAGATLTAAGAQLTGTITLDDVTTASGHHGVAVGVADTVMSLAASAADPPPRRCRRHVPADGRRCRRPRHDQHQRQHAGPGDQRRQHHHRAQLHWRHGRRDDSLSGGASTTTVHARGPPGGGASDINGSRTVLTAGPLTLTVANSGNADPVGPTAWLRRPLWSGRPFGRTDGGWHRPRPHLRWRRRAPIRRRRLSTVVISGSDGNDIAAPRHRAGHLRDLRRRRRRRHASAVPPPTRPGWSPVPVPAPSAR